MKTSNLCSLMHLIFHLHQNEKKTFFSLINNMYSECSNLPLTIVRENPFIQSIMIYNVNSINMHFQYVMHIPGQTNREILLGLAQRIT